MRRPARLPSLVPDLARGKVLQALDGQLVHGVNLVVVSWVSEGEGQEALLLQVGFWKASVNTQSTGQGPAPFFCAGTSPAQTASFSKSKGPLWGAPQAYDLGTDLGQ